MLSALTIARQTSQALSLSTCLVDFAGSIPAPASMPDVKLLMTMWLADLFARKL